MTNYKEIIRLHSLGLNKTRIAESCGCARSTVITALHKAEENGLSWNAVKNLSSEEVTRKLYPATSMGQRYSMPDYEWVHKEMQKSGVTLSLLWVEYCERCRQNGELPYKSTQFNSTTPTMFTKRKRPCTWSTSPVRTSRWTGPVRPLGLRTRTPASACPPISL